MSKRVIFWNCGSSLGGHGPNFETGSDCLTLGPVQTVPADAANPEKCCCTLLLLMFPCLLIILLLSKYFHRPSPTML